MASYQGPIKPGTSKKRFRETGKSVTIKSGGYHGPVRPGRDEEVFRRTGRSVIAGSTEASQAQREIEVFVSLTDHIDDQWVTQFNELYRNILNGLNPQSKSVASLNWGASVTQPAESELQVDTGKEITKVKKLFVSLNIFMC